VSQKGGPMNYRFMCMFFYSSIIFSCSAIAQDSNQSVVSSAVTFELNGGRFGDNLLSYSRAKWLSYQYGIPLMLYPFPYSDQLVLYEQEQMLCIDDFDRVVRLPSSDKYTLKKDNNTLYINHWRTKVSLNWNDSIFIAELKKLIAPRYEMQKVVIPQGYVSVAVHVRNGGGYGADTPQEQERCPLRFVPDEFFIAQIERIARMFQGQQLYVYIFTDHKQPAVLAEKFSNALSNENIIIDYQKAENGHNMNVLEDFFSMMQFDCLIRPGSHFSRFVERLGQAQLSIYPYSVAKEGNSPAVIDVIGIKTRNAKGGWKTAKVKIV
jgi:hypothetical protein